MAFVGVLGAALSGGAAVAGTVGAAVIGEQPSQVPQLVLLVQLNQLEQPRRPLRQLKEQLILKYRCRKHRLLANAVALSGRFCHNVHSLLLEHRH